jgi:hypothetical protein
MNAVIDLNQMVEGFLDEAVWRCRNEGLREDEAVIRILDDRKQNTEIRRNEVLKWLGSSYSALQGLNKDDRFGVASAILDFADARDSGVSPTSEVEIVRLFSDLHGSCRSRVHRNKDGTLRDLTSPTSKALWCCYPDVIPIFDSYAHCALRVVSRFMGLVRPADDVPAYDRFVSVWLDVYRRVETTIDADRLGGYPYKVRVFDRILWIIGQPDFGSVPYNTKPEYYGSDAAKRSQFKQREKARALKARAKKLGIYDDVNEAAEAEAQVKFENWQAGRSPELGKEK